jgi:transcriptional regulator with XRE-family HTH domain
MANRWTPSAAHALDVAIVCGDYSDVLKRARERMGWSQTHLAAKFGCHPSVISRLESRRRPLRDVELLRRLADLLDLPPAAFGLHDRMASQHKPGSTPRVGSIPSSEEDDIVRRRTFLMASGILGTALVARPGTADAAPLDPAAVLTTRLESVLLGGGQSVPHSRLVSAAMIHRGLAAAHSDFDRADYLALADTLPQITVAAESAAVRDGVGAQELVAQTYSLITRVLIKLPASGLEWISADRALRAATDTADPLVLAEAERMMASVCRRAGHHNRAQELVLAAADRLDLSGPDLDSRQLLLHGVLMCTAGYGAARAGNRELAHDLLTEATTTVDRLDHPKLQQRLRANVTSHQISASYVLGDPAAALRHARAAGPLTFATSEREGRFLVDVALTYQALDKPGPAYNALCEAELRAPGEVRTRSTARSLVLDLLNQRGTTLPGIRELAIRTHTA